MIMTERQPQKLTRRQFLQAGLAAAAGAVLTGCQLPETKPMENKKATLPENIKDWQKMVKDYDTRLTKVFGPPNKELFTGPVEQACRFWLLLTEEEKKQEFNKDLDVSGSFVFPHYPGFNTIYDTKSKQINIIDQLIIKAVYLRLPEQKEFAQMGELGSLLKNLTQEEALELGMTLNLLNLRTGYGEETLSLAPTPFLIRDFFGLRTILGKVDNQQFSSEQQWSSVDLMARLNSLKDKSSIVSPGLSAKLDNFSSFFFDLMEKIDLTPQQVWENYRAGTPIALLNKVGQFLYNNSFRIEEINNISLTDDSRIQIPLAGAIALTCADNPVSACAKNFYDFFKFSSPKLPQASATGFSFNLYT